MQFDPLLTDDALLAEIGARISAARVARNLTQHQLAGESGVAKTTIERVEKGLSVTLPNFLKILRALELIGGLEQLLAPPPVSPIDLVRREGRRRKRATGARARGNDALAGRDGGRRFGWGDEADQGRD